MARNCWVYSWLVLGKWCFSRKSVRIFGRAAIHIVVRQCDHGTGVEGGWLVVVGKHIGLVDLDPIGDVPCASCAALVAFEDVCGKEFLVDGGWNGMVWSRCLPTHCRKKWRKLD